MPRPQRTRAVSAAQVRSYAAKAEEFAEAAASDLEAGRNIAATSLAVHAGINSADAVCGARLGNGPPATTTTRCWSCSGRRARTAPQVERELRRLLPLKTKAEYDPDDIARSVAAKAVERAQRCAAVARQGRQHRPVVRGQAAEADRGQESPDYRRRSSDRHASCEGEDMPLEVGIWRVDGQPRRMATAAMPLESRLEELIESDPAILGEPLLFIGRQVPTAHGKYIDLLAVDASGGLHVLELKRDRTPRDVVAQTLDYGSWVESLSHEEVLGIFEDYRPGEAFEEAFSERFVSLLPTSLTGDTPSRWSHRTSTRRQHASWSTWLDSTYP